MIAIKNIIGFYTSLGLTKAYFLHPRSCRLVIALAAGFSFMWEMIAEQHNNNE